MGDLKTLTSQELTDIKSLNENVNKTVLSIGELDIKIYLIKKQLQELETEKSYLLSDYDKLQQKEKSITDLLLSKYGEGKIDLESGKIELI